MDTILDHPTVDAMHVHPSRDNASSHRTIHFQTQQRLFAHTDTRPRQSTRFPRAPPRQEGPLLFSIIPCPREILTHLCYSFSRTTPQRHSPSPILNSRSCRKHIRPSIASRHWITCTWAPLLPELLSHHQKSNWACASIASEPDPRACRWRYRRDYPRRYVPQWRHASSYLSVDDP